MNNNVTISEEIQEYVNQHLKQDPAAKIISDKEKLVLEKRNELIDLEGELDVLKKKRPEIDIKYRDSINWCLDIDSGNPYYFLKSKEGLVRCVEFKNKISLTAKQNSAFGAILSTMFKDKKVGRITHDNMFWYGVIDLFEKDNDGFYTKIKKKYEKKIPDLKQVNIKY